MSHSKAFNLSRRQSEERDSKDSFDRKYGFGDYENQIIESEERQPNFGTKRTYDKQNQTSNYSASVYSQQKASSNNSSKQNSQQPKTKKYAYIKNTHSLIQSHQYESQQSDSPDSNKKSSEKVFHHYNEKSEQLVFVSKDEEIIFLRQLVKEEKQKFEQFQQQTIKNQIKILQTINNLETKLKQLKHDNLVLHQENSSLKAQIQAKDERPIPKFKNIDSHYQNNSFNPKSDHLNDLNSHIQRLSLKLEKRQSELNALEQSHKKIKGVATGLADMMKKVDHIQTPKGEDEAKFAWKWIKKVVWEYEAIRKKAYEWKKAYDELNKDSQNENSVSSEDTY